MDDDRAHETTRRGRLTRVTWVRRGVVGVSGGAALAAAVAIGATTTTGASGDPPSGGTTGGASRSRTAESDGFNPFASRQARPAAQPAAQPAHQPAPAPHAQSSGS